MTRTNGTTASARWDLDYIAGSDSWLVQIPDDPTSIPWIADFSASKGTLVVWEKFGIGADKEDTDRKTTDFVRQLDEACSHLELVFHRFLSGEPGSPEGSYSREQPPLGALRSVPFQPSGDNLPAPQNGYELRMRTYSCSRSLFRTMVRSTPAEWDRYAGPEGYLRNQGFYVYRERRLIIHGTWFGLARQTELTKLARVRIDMPNSLDAAWKIDVKEGIGTACPQTVRKRLRRIIEPLGAIIQACVHHTGTKAH